MKDLAQQAHELLTEQNCSWDALRIGRENLAKVQIRSFDFGNFVVQAAFNPARLASSLAKVDDHSIRSRKCFLCDANRPPEQKALDCSDGFRLMCNPFPILPEHFTLILDRHVPQRILPFFGKMLDLARNLGSRYTTFYNGPQSGASAPDHMHFQAGTKDYMPIDVEYVRVKRSYGRHGGAEVFVGQDYLRCFIGIESADSSAVERAFARLHETFHALAPNTSEPMVNVLASFDAGAHRWRVVIFPRVKHRPSFYFAVDHTKMLLSPGTVDVGGIVTTVLEEDFNRVGKEHLVQMFEEITVSAKVLEQLARAACGE